MIYLKLIIQENEEITEQIINLNENQSIAVFQNVNDFDTSRGSIQISSMTSLNNLWNEIKNLNYKNIIEFNVVFNNEIIYTSNYSVNSLGYDFSSLDSSTISYKINFVFNRK